MEHKQDYTFSLMPKLSFTKACKQVCFAWAYARSLGHFMGRLTSNL